MCICTDCPLYPVRPLAKRVGWKPTQKAKGFYEKMPFNRMKWKLELIDRINEDQLKDGIPPVIYGPDKLATVFEEYR